MSGDKKIYDAAIVGAGPAGSSLAIRLAMAGMSVLLVEQKRFPREKLCGEFISPECLIHFAELGVMPDIAAAGGSDLAETLFFARNGKGVSVKSEWFGSTDSMALGLSRAEMDERLIEHARASGVEVLEETNVIGLLLANRRVSGIRIRGRDADEAEIYAALTVDATGRSRSLVRRLDRSIQEKRAAKFVAFKTHLSHANLKPGACEIYAYRGGYGGCNRVENDLYNLCFIASAEDTKRMDSDPERVMREIVFTNERAAEAMSAVQVVKPWLAVPIERFGRGELVPANGLLTVGDSAAFIDPFTGSGMLLALESSKIASNAIIKYRDDFAQIAADYRKHYALAFGRRLRICSILRYAAFVPFLAEATISILGTSLRLRRSVARATRFSAEPGV
ncbi:MAG TPA: NAD(P)/FAD-dependent oxidoreductase [Pyrinomonadaceae bacterium]|nr:NAD(P)/FAD-dependent oxidoreductase [Acidobacteriota bacterium]HQZ95175.1 NAD(P)/FAD-dependent oxidoreductase [Pyrinomonadaceae bacterium]